MKKTLVLTLLVLALAMSLTAQIYVKTKTHTDPMSMMGQTTPGSDVVTETWIADDKTAQVTPDQTFIVDLSKKMAWFVNHKDKSYVEAPLPLDFAKLLPPEAAAMAGMLKMTATVNPTGETKKIGQWNCQGFDMTVNVMGMPMKTKVWASTDTPIDMAKYFNLYIPVLQGQMRLDDTSVKEMQKIKGYQISTVMDAEMMGAKIHVTADVLEIAKKPAPAGIFAVPAGYAKKATLDMDALQKR
jgi:hypothetical protein